MKKHIYFVPGTAANSKIFERLKFPSDKFELHYLEWLIPLSINESIENYAQRLCAKVKHSNPILVGVSFGGIMVQEMSKLIPCQKIVIISSVKNKYELSKRLQFIKNSKVYRIAPIQFINSIEKLLTFFYGNKTAKRIEAYRIYLSIRDPLYLKWAIKQALYWKQEKTIPGIIHIHGDKDPIFPITSITSCSTIKGGSHVMILTKAKIISSILLEKFQ